jgi:hypothetical protein
MDCKSLGLLFVIWIYTCNHKGKAFGEKMMEDDGGHRGVGSHPPRPRLSLSQRGGSQPLPPHFSRFFFFFFGNFHLGIIGIHKHSFRKMDKI